jgi:thiol-disulfide isomerase/thioredoxin
MLRKTFLFFLLLSNVTIHAQQLNFSGQISGVADENLNAQFPEDWFGNAWAEEIPVRNNQFSKQVQIPASGWMKLNYKGKDRKLYLWKGADSLNIKFEADFLESEVQLSGDGAEAAKFMAQLNEDFSSRFSPKWLEEQAKDATNVDAMEMDAFSVRNDVIHAMEKFEGQLPDAFQSWFKNHASYYYYLSLFEFSSAKSTSSNIPKATEIPKVLIEGLTWERMNMASELDSKYFRELLLHFVHYKSLEQYDFMKFPDRQTTVQEAYNLARTELQGQSLQYFLTKTMLRESEAIQPSLLRLMRDRLKETENADVYVELVEDSLKERLNAKDDEVEVVLGQETDHPKIDIEVMGLNGKKFKLSDLKGKVIYLDVWASWCGPCRKQFPHAKELKEELTKKEKKNIEFLYISIDNTESVWKAAIEKLGIDGIHGLSEGGWSSEIAAKFGVSSIPRYLIFDKKGNVVDPNAPRPSDPRLIEILRKLAE